MSQITTHILDIAKGKPAKDVNIHLSYWSDKEWSDIATGITNEDGRIKDLLQPDVILQTGIYKLKFDIKEYFDKQNVATLYPYVEIVFEIATAQHYHVPLLLSPYGYSTYRGS